MASAVTFDSRERPLHMVLLRRDIERVVLVVDRTHGKNEEIFDETGGRELAQQDTDMAAHVVVPQWSRIRDCRTVHPLVLAWRPTPTALRWGGRGRIGTSRSLFPPTDFSVHAGDCGHSEAIALASL